MEEKKKLTPYVPDSSTMPEFTFKALFLGVVLALIFGAANAYIGMKAGLTISAVFPAAVMAMAVLRLMRGNILEENMARTTGVVGESLIAGAIFTIPAFIIAGVWDKFRFWESAAIMVIGGLLGSLFIVVLRRTLVVESDLPFPESVAASEIVKAGQKGQTGAAFVFGAMGLAAVWELLKNSRAVHLIQENANGFFPFAGSSTGFETPGDGETFDVAYQGGLTLETPSASPALCGVGWIVGPRISAVLFAGAVLGWWLLVPAGMYLNPQLPELWEGAGGGVDTEGLLALAGEVWFKQIRPLAVGTMIVAAFYTLYNLR
ncbi:MAG: oligopeptide transporter, OPT family, partial [bacterium]|nr:oligopeptide transporter, OPT family [bacterium]